MDSHACIQLMKYFTTTKWRKYHLNILIDAKRTLEKIQHEFMMKMLNKLGIEGAWFNIIKLYIIWTHRQNHCEWEKAKTIPQDQKIWSKTGCLFYIALEVSGSANRRRKNDRHSNRKERSHMPSVWRWCFSIMRLLRNKSWKEPYW
jgi:hypothetical protein